MRSAQENRIIGKILVGAMCIDGTLNKKEREHVAQILTKRGAPELVADVGAALENDFGDLDLFKECRELLEHLGNKASTATPDIFKLVASVVASDRYVSAQEAQYLSALARRLKLSTQQSQTILKGIIEEKRSRLEISGDQVDALIHPHLKELLSFCGADEKVGELSENAIEEHLYEADFSGQDKITVEDVEKALTILGLSSSGGSLEEAEEVWKEIMEGIKLGQLAYQGAPFVGAALDRAQKIHGAYQTLLTFEEMRNAEKKKPDTSKEEHASVTLDNS
jgi:tellurite resistance protein